MASTTATSAGPWPGDARRNMRKCARNWIPATTDVTRRSLAVFMAGLLSSDLQSASITMLRRVTCHLQVKKRKSRRGVESRETGPGGNAIALPDREHPGSGGGPVDAARGAGPPDVRQTPLRRVFGFAGRNSDEHPRGTAAPARGVGNRS